LADRWHDDFAGLHRFFEHGFFGVVDAVSKRGVDDHSERVELMLVHHGLDSIVELLQARQIAALGRDVGAINDVLELIKGQVRPEMVEVLRRVKAAGYATACLTNNFRGSNDDADVAGGSGRADVDEVMAMFDHVVESSRVGVRKPELGFYEIALDLVKAPADRCVFLDDLGINLKPARAMGMTTIKVVGAAEAITELEGHLGMELR